MTVPHHRCNARADFQCSLVSTFSSSPPIRFISVELFLFSPIANLRLSAARYRALDPKGRTVRARLYGHVDWTFRHSCLSAARIRLVPRHPILLLYIMSTSVEHCSSPSTYSDDLVHLVLHCRQTRTAPHLQYLDFPSMHGCSSIPVLLCVI